ncbi:hypothetical protein VT84_25430 [Gemmata sp. SH-PL17]|uniref:hypothetical protein n=1 Tax=Gemmata sp. SH-PL17 TaxID=1630693 RepID=UPI0004B520A2|nr:hypothetical protein [Gemmata sp. SH-PL17]AMV27769.1 hypothetical protein VT84_25430 [Gemmata sp. SH-PL17]
MYPSGRWDGFWFQDHVGRQAMTPFTLAFAGGEVTGSGRDVVGVFTFGGTYDEATGNVVMVKQYHGKHRVLYVGQSDGEGSIQGTWSIGKHHTGPFLLRPIVARPRGDEPIHEIG